MKKIIPLLILCTLLVSVIAGCGNDPLTSGTTATTAATDASGNTVSATEETSKAVNKDAYEDSLDGLAKYFNDKEYIVNEKDNITEMRADLIGAKSGNRYTNGTATVELYEYDTKKTNDTAKEIIASVEKNGKFTLYNKEIEAYLSDSNKYLMIYNDTAIGDDTDSDAYKTKQSAIKDLKSFG